jgi:SapC
MPGTDIKLASRMNHAQIGLSEAGVAASDFPLLFMKDSDSGLFRLIALFSLKPDTNFFVVNDQWQTTYLPLSLLGAPFYLSGPGQALCIDEGSGLVTTDTGGALFSADGEETEKLSGIRAMFDYLRSDLSAANDFATMLVDLDLVRPLHVTMEFHDGQTEVVEGLYSISPLKLDTLEDATILDLYRRHFLDKISIIINSLGQVNRIQQLSNLQSERKIVRLETVMSSQ